MNTVAENNVLPPESYVVEIDGNIRSVYGIFIEALKAGMELKQKFPHSHQSAQRNRDVRFEIVEIFPDLAGKSQREATAS